ncbi:MAG: SDR family oxidoreductase [Candidatus Hodarchaeales archaeon]|jgi:NADP-dependent 3-hydroxy acid dehydrogenase YdfG
MNTNQNDSNNNKVIIVTGASKGIGKSISEKLSMKNTVIMVARSIDLLNRIKDSVSHNEGEISTLQADVTNEEDVKKVIDFVINKYSRIDVLINNAGIGKFKRIDEFTKEDYQQVFDVNVLGTFLFTKYAVPYMIEKKSGQIINISSIAGLSGFKTGTIYSASKFAVNGFTESLREDLKEYGIAVSVVCPGGVKTTFGNSSVDSKIGRDYLLEAEDVAKTVEYLVNESQTANTKLVELKPRRRKEFRE